MITGKKDLSEFLFPVDFLERVKPNTADRVCTILHILISVSVGNLRCL